MSEGVTPWSTAIHTSITANRVYLDIVPRLSSILQLTGLRLCILAQLHPALRGWTALISPTHTATACTPACQTHLALLLVARPLSSHPLPFPLSALPPQTTAALCAAGATDRVIIVVAPKLGAPSTPADRPACFARRPTDNAPLTQPLLLVNLALRRPLRRKVSMTIVCLRARARDGGGVLRCLIHRAIAVDPTLRLASHRPARRVASLRDRHGLADCQCPSCPRSTIWRNQTNMMHMVGLDRTWLDRLYMSLSRGWTAFCRSTFHLEIGRASQVPDSAPRHLD